MFRTTAFASLITLGLMICVGAGSLIAQNGTAQSKAAEAQAKKTAEKASAAEVEAKKTAEGNASTAESAAKAKAEYDALQADKSVNAYRLDFSVNEMEDGKKINTRQYSMNVKSPDANEIKIGTRVPVEAKQGEFQYLDVGTRIWCRLRDQADFSALTGNVLLNVRAEVSNFAMPEQQGQQVRPVLRQMNIEASTITALGKTVVVGSVDDPGSKRQFQLEVTVTKLK